MLTKVLIYMILFFLVASPSTFKFMRRMLGGWVASAEGLPHAPGLLLHSAVYVLLACYLPAKLVSGFADEYEEEKYAEDYEEKYIGEYGSTTTPMGLSDATRRKAGNSVAFY
jgi:hypothetical protein